MIDPETVAAHQTILGTSLFGSCLKTSEQMTNRNQIGRKINFYWVETRLKNVNIVLKIITTLFGNRECKPIISCH